jgi:hypothetical protein
MRVVTVKSYAVGEPGDHLPGLVRLDLRRGYTQVGRTLSAPLEKIERVSPSLDHLGGIDQSVSDPG